MYIVMMTTKIAIIIIAIITVITKALASVIQIFSFSKKHSKNLITHDSGG